MKKLSIIIVNYNSKEMLRDCLTSIQQHLSVDYEVIVVDNDSTDNSIALCSHFESLPQFKIIRAAENMGFAKGCNIGAAASRGEILHFLNPDTALQSGADSDYKKVFLNPDSVYVTPLFNRDGSVENARMEIPFLKEIFLWNTNRNKAKYWCRGASVIISKENYEKVGRWCEEYFIYGEDMDLFYTFWKHNLEIITLDVPVFHYGGGCSQNVWSNLQREIIVQKSFRRFFRRHSNMLHYTLVKLYYLMFNLIKHPRRVPFDLKAWYKSMF